MRRLVLSCACGSIVCFVASVAGCILFAKFWHRYLGLEDGNIRINYLLCRIDDNEVRPGWRWDNGNIDCGASSQLLAFVLDFEPFVPRR
jgi:hypothetical protein